MRNDILDLREVIKKLVPILTKKGLRVTQMGAEAYVRANPKTYQPEIVNIPSVGDNATPEFIQALQGFIDHEVAHVLLTDFSLYGTDPRKPNKQATKKFVNLHNIVEDTMIEREIVKIFPGSRKNIATTRRYFLKNVIEPILRDAKTPQKQYQYLLVVILRALAGHEEMQEFMDRHNHWENPWIKQFVEAIDSKTKQDLRNCTSTKETLRITVTLAQIMESNDPPSQVQQFSETLAQIIMDKNEDQDQTSHKEQEVENKQTDEQTDTSDKNNSDSVSQDNLADESDIPSQYRLAGGVGNEVGDLVDGESKSSGGVGGDQADSSIFDVPDEALQAADISKQIAIKISQQSSELIDAADYSVFTRDYDKIEPLKTPDKIDDTWIPAMRDKTHKMIGVMQKNIERALASQSMVANIPGFKRGRLHAPSLYRLTHDDDRIFTKRHEAKSKDTAVSLLVDNSGSMVGDKMHLAMLAAYALSETLEKVRINHEMLGFTTVGRNDMPDFMVKAAKEQAVEETNRFDRVWPIVMPIYKNFNERISATVRKRIAYAAHAQRNLNNNIDGESLLYAVDRLSKQHEKRKVVIVLSDGQPAGCSKAEEHLRYAVKRVEASGIECIGIGIMDCAVEHYYPKHIVLDELEELPALVMRQLYKILTH